MDVICSRPGVASRRSKDCARTRYCTPRAPRSPEKGVAGSLRQRLCYPLRVTPGTRHDMETGQGNPRNSRKPVDDPRTQAVIGAAIEVQTQLGTGYLERVYHKALEVELAAAGVPFLSEVEIPVRYKGQLLPVCYRGDLVCYDDVLVELKAQREFGAPEHSQVINYLVAGQFPVGLLLNFGESPLGIKRYVGPTHFRPRTPSIGSDGN
jgi:GxxExxY protein